MGPMQAKSPHFVTLPSSTKMPRFIRIWVRPRIIGMGSPKGVSSYEE